MLHFTPQSDYVYINGRSSFNFVGRYENITESYEVVRETLGLGKLWTMKRNGKQEVEGQTSGETPEITDRMLGALSKFYSEDFRRFGYEIRTFERTRGGRW